MHWACGMSWSVQPVSEGVTNTMVLYTKGYNESLRNKMSTKSSPSKSVSDASRSEQTDHDVTALLVPVKGILIMYRSTACIQCITYVRDLS